MGAFKKKIRSEIRRAGRLIIDKSYKEFNQTPISKRQSNFFVSELEKAVIPEIMHALRNGINVKNLTK